MADAVATRGSGHVVASLTGRRLIRSGGLWGLVYGLYVTSSAFNFTTIAKTAIQQRELAQTLGKNAGLHALLGTAHHVDTVAGFTAWRSLGVPTLVGAVWGMLAGTRVLRGEEEAGRWELLLAGRTTRRAATVQALSGLAAGVLALWVVTGCITVAVGQSKRAPFGFSPAIFFATALIASTAMFMALAALCAQLGGTRRAANALCSAFLGLAFMVRMVADSGPGLAWLRWFSPLGWVEELQPLTGSHSGAFDPVVALIVAAALATAFLAGRRDIGSGTLPANDTRPARTRLLGGPLGLAVRLGRPLAIGWIAAISAFGLLGGLVA